MQILLIGKTGQIGCELQHALKGLGHLTVWGREELDLSRPEGIVDKVVSVRPDLIVNAGAYTAVDKAESEPDLAMAVNAAAPGKLGLAASHCGAGVIHYSTDYVFDGKNSERPYREDDTPCPVNAYGKSKLEGERALSDSGACFIILRVCGVYGLRGKNFLLTMQHLARQGKALRIVGDQWGAPTWSREIAKATADIIARLKEEKSGSFLEAMQKAAGIYHLSCSGKTSWYGFADAIFELSGLDPERCPIPSEEYPTPAARPNHWVLDNGKLKAGFGIELPAWKKSLSECIDLQKKELNVSGQPQCNGAI